MPLKTAAPTLPVFILQTACKWWYYIKTLNELPILLTTELGLLSLWSELIYLRSLFIVSLCLQRLFWKGGIVEVGVGNLTILDPDCDLRHPQSTSQGIVQVATFNVLFLLFPNFTWPQWLVDLRYVNNPYAALTGHITSK